MVNNTIQILGYDKSKPNGYDLIKGLVHRPEFTIADTLFSTFISDRQQVTLEDVTPKDNVVLFPIQFLDPEDFTSKNLKTILTKEVIDLINEKSNNVYLFIWYPTEGFQLSLKKYKLLKELKKFDDSKIIDPYKILFVYGELNFVETLNKVYKKKPELKTKIPYKKNFFAFNYFERSSSAYIHSKEYNTFKYQIQNKKLQHHFIYKNGNFRVGRLFVLCFMALNDLLDKGLYSVLDTASMSDQFLEEPRFFHQLAPYTVDLRAYYKTYKKLHRRFPIVVDLPKSATSRTNKPVFPTEILDKCAVEIVVETHLDVDNDNSLNFTEKVFFPMIYKIPAIMLGPPKLYAYLRHKGYRSFPMLFDESFANEPDVVERTKKFALELDRFTNKPLSEIQEIINSEEVKEILNWNYNLLRSEVNKESTLDKIFLNKFRYPE